MNSILICNVRVYRPGVPLSRRPRAFEIRHGRFYRFFDEPYPDGGHDRIDMHEAYVYPGFFDSHTHFVWGGSALGPLNFSNVSSVDELRARIAKVCYEMDSDPGRGWIVGLGLDQSVLNLTRADLDEITGDYPTIIETKDLHSAIANRKALSIAGYWDNVTDPEGGRVERVATGEPTGWLREFAVHAIKKHIPEATTVEQRRWFEAAAEYALANGVVAVGENADCSLAKQYHHWAEASALPLRIDLWLNEGWPNDRTLHFPKHHSDRLRIATQKLFLDGSMGSQTAWFREPYCSNPESNGFPLHTDEELFEVLVACSELGWDSAIHNIGDAACAQLLRVADRLELEGYRTNTICGEHLQVITPDAAERMASLGITASMQPIHLAGDRRWMEARIGKDRCRLAFAFRSIIDAGVTLRFGSDWPVESLNPIAGLRTAILRTGYSNDLGESWYPEQGLDFDQALAAFTINPHLRAGWREAGRLEPGNSADFLILEQDLASIDPREWIEEIVVQTWIGGECLFNKNSL